MHLVQEKYTIILSLVMTRPSLALVLVILEHPSPIGDGFHWFQTHIWPVFCLSFHWVSVSEHDGFIAEEDSQEILRKYIHPTTLIPPSRTLKTVRGLIRPNCLTFLSLYFFFNWPHIPCFSQGTCLSGCFFLALFITSWETIIYLMCPFVYMQKKQQYMCQLNHGKGEGKYLLKYAEMHLCDFFSYLGDFPGI